MKRHRSKREQRRRILSMVLGMSMMLSMIPESIFAAETPVIAEAQQRPLFV